MNCLKYTIFYNSLKYPLEIFIFAASTNRYEVLSEDDFIHPLVLKPAISTKAEIHCELIRQVFALHRLHTLCEECKLRDIPNRYVQRYERYKIYSNRLCVAINRSVQRSKLI